MNDEYIDYSNFRKTVTLVEGENTFTFYAVNSSGKQSEIITKTVVFEIGAPTLIIDPVPERVSTKTITITGRATDTNDSSPKIYMNGQYIDYTSFRKTVTLNEGENTFTFYATNSMGKQSEIITKKVVFGVGAPTLIIDPVPEIVSTKTITITGRATDTNDSSPKIYMNGQYVDYTSFRKTVTLNEGENTFTFYATNSMGKQSETVTKTVVFDIPVPTLVIDPIPDKTSNSSVTITGRATDANDSNPKIYLNGDYLDYGSFRTTVALEVGENTFTFYATNALGKKSEEKMLKIIYTPITQNQEAALVEEEIS